MEDLNFYLGPAAIALSKGYDATLAEAGVTRSVICAETKAGYCVTSLSRVTCKIKTGGKDWENVTFTMQDGSQPYGLELAISGLHAGDKVACVLQGPATLRDLDVMRRDNAKALLSLQIEITNVDVGWKDAMAMSADEKCDFGNLMNDIGKRLYAASDIDRAIVKLKAAAACFDFIEPESGGVVFNPQGRANNEKCFRVSRLVYLNLAQLMFVKKNYEECELYCGDVLWTKPGPNDAHLTAKALFRRGCARIELGKWCANDKDIRITSAEADLIRAKDLNADLDIEKPFRIIYQKRAQRAAREALHQIADASATEEPRESTTLAQEQVSSSETEPASGTSWKYYGIMPLGKHWDIQEVLETIRQENLDHLLSFVSEDEQRERIAERERFYNELLSASELGKTKCTWL